MVDLVVIPQMTLCSISLEADGGQQGAGTRRQLMHNPLADNGGSSFTTVQQVSSAYAPFPAKSSLANCICGACLRCCMLDPFHHFLCSLQPAMDVYSLGVLLFIMLVGRKPWDAQRSHTLAYAVQPTCEAPGLRDPVFTGLSAPAQKLLCWMLAEDPSRRPSTQQVLGHNWVLQGGVCKVCVLGMWVHLLGVRCRLAGASTAGAHTGIALG